MVAALMAVAKAKTYEYRALGERIAVLREQRNVTQRDLAARIGKSEGYFGRVETGESRPRQAVLRDIARELRTSYEELAILAKFITPEEAERWQAPPDRIDLFREMSAPDVSRDIVAEAWDYVKMLLHRGQHTYKAQVEQDLPDIPAESPTTQEEAGG